MAAIFFHDGQWLDEQPLLIGPMHHAFWQSSIVFDGARAFGGLPELANAKLTPVLAPLRALDLVVGPDHLKRARRDRERLAQVGVETTLGQGRFSGMA